MHPQLQTLAVAASLVVLLTVVQLIRKGKLREEYALIWLIGAIVVLLLSIFRGSLQLLADLAGIGYAPSLLFIIGLFLLMAIQLSQAITISKLASHNRDLAQRLAITEWQLRHRLERDGTESRAADEAKPIDAELAQGDRRRAEEQDAGDWSRWSDLRPDQAVGGAGTPAYDEETVGAGHGR